LAEYVGELISNWEADTRGKYYDAAFVNCSYIFALNKDYVIDAWRYGNKTRFINHCDKKDQNLQAKVLLVNGEHRIGFYATKNIKAGDELLFDYGSTFTQKNIKTSKKTAGGAKARKTAAGLGGGRGRKTAVFEDDDEDEKIIIATDVQQTRGGARGRGKSRGGRRRGAGRKKAPERMTREELNEEEAQIRQQLIDSDIDMHDAPDEHLMGDTPPDLQSSSDEFEGADSIIEESDEEENHRKSKRPRKGPMRYTR
jgi:hypothetical protein